MATIGITVKSQTSLFSYRSWSLGISDIATIGITVKSQTSLSATEWCLGISDIATIGITVKSQTSLPATWAGVLKFQT